MSICCMSLRAIADGGNFRRPFGFATLFCAVISNYLSVQSCHEGWKMASKRQGWYQQYFFPCNTKRLEPLTDPTYDTSKSTKEQFFTPLMKGVCHAFFGGLRGAEYVFETKECLLCSLSAINNSRFLKYWRCMIFHKKLKLSSFCKHHLFTWTLLFLVFLPF